MINTPNIKIAIASGKGGTGKTLVSTNLFYALKQQGFNIKLIDCDAEEPNDMVFFSGNVFKSVEVNQKVPVIDESKCTFCGKCHEYCNYNAIFIIPPAKIIKVIDDLCHGCGACSVACMYDSITEKDVSLGAVDCYVNTKNAQLIESKMKVGAYSPVALIKEAIRQAGDVGIIILDAPPGTSCPFIQTVVVADYVILVTEPTPFGLSDLKQSIETLKTMNKAYGVIINRSGLGDNATYEYLKQQDVNILMEIPFDKAIASHYSKGLLFAEYSHKWEEKFISLFESISKEYGNSCN